MKHDNKGTGTNHYETRLQMAIFFLKGNIGYFLTGIFFACLLSVVELINPKVIGYTVDSIIGEKETKLPAVLQDWIMKLGGRSYLVEHLWMVAFFVVGIALLSALCRYLFGLLNAKGAEGLVKKVRDSLYEHILHLPYAWHGENATGDIIQRCTSDVETIKRFLSEQLTNLFRVIVMIVLSLVFMARIHMGLTLIAAIFIPVIVGYSLRFHNQLGPAFERVDTEEGNLSAIAQENLTGVRVVRAFGRERYERERFEAKNEEYSNMWIHMMKIMSGFWAISDAITGMQILLVMVVGAYFCVNDSITAGEYITFFVYNAMLTWPVRNLGRVISEMSKAGISISRIMYIMNASEEQDQEGAMDWPKNGDIAFEHVSYTFENGSKPVLEDITFSIGEGKTIGILGGTGSGKSTLIHLLDRLYELSEEQGRITIGGVDIRELKASALRENIGLVLQEPYLFSRTLEENIMIGAKDATHADVEKVVALACLDGAIGKFAEGYETEVGERGVTLSGGQKQRTAIAQMMIRKPKVMIFDDSLSAVDAETDSKIRAAIAEHTKEATVILISHRVTTIMHADEIIVLDQGHLVERGSHQELLSKQGIYHRIFELQTAGEKENE